MTISFDIGAEREEAPADWTAGIPSTRWEDMQLTFLDDPSAAERYAIWAPLVDQVLDALWEAVRAGDIISQDFSAGFDGWGAPIFQANSDEVEEFIRGLFPPDIAERIEIRRETSIVPPDVATP